MKRKTAAIVACALGLVCAVGAFWWLESSTRPARTEAPGAEIPRVNTVVAPPAPAPQGGTEKPAEVAEVSEEQAAPAMEAAPTTPSVGDILAEPDDNFVRVAKKLSAIALDARAPMAEREEALAHTLNLSAGNEAEVLTPLVKDANLPDALAETILSEALNRPLAYQADLYLEALATRKSPQMQANIREHLAFLVGGEDKGPNPADWVEAIKAAKASWPE